MLRHVTRPVAAALLAAGLLAPGIAAWPSAGASPTVAAAAPVAAPSDRPGRPSPVPTPPPTAAPTPTASPVPSPVPTASPAATARSGSSPRPTGPADGATADPGAAGSSVPPSASEVAVYSPPPDDGSPRSERGAGTSPDLVGEIGLLVDELAARPGADVAFPALGAGALLVLWLAFRWLRMDAEEAARRRAAGERRRPG